jgi:hypothetical protein
MIQQMEEEKAGKEEEEGKGQHIIAAPTPQATLSGLPQLPRPRL